MEKYTAYGFSVEEVGDVSRLSWSDPNNSLGENESLSSFTEIITQENLFVTKSLEYYFKNDIETFINDNPTTAILRFKIRYKLSLANDNETEESSPSISINPNLHIDGVNLNKNYQIKNGTANIKSNDQINTCEVSFFATDLPTSQELSDSLFGFSFYIDGNNQTLNTLDIKIYDILIEIVSGTGVSYPLCVIDGYYVDIGDSFSLPSISTNSTRNKTFYIYNAGDTNMIIQKGGITSQDTNLFYFSKNPFPSTTITTITPQNQFEVKFIYKNTIPKENIVSISITSNSTLSPSYFYFTFISVVDSSAPLIELSYQGNKIDNFGIFSLSSFPVSVPTVVSVKISNLGSSSLSLYSILVSGDGSLASGSISSTGTIASSISGNININLSTSSLGNKTVNIKVTSNDNQNPNYEISLKYAVLAHSKVEFKEGFSSGKTEKTLIDGQTNEIGTVDRNVDLKRYFVLRNSGIYKTMIINSISSSTDDIAISELPTLPYTLFPNSANSISFYITLETKKVGFKEGSLLIDYTEGDVY